jgi:Ni,Fe-hydrogenase maturation factor
LLDAFHLLGNPPEVILFAVSIASLQEVGTELSAEIAAVVPEVARKVAEEVGIKV